MNILRTITSSLTGSASLICSRPYFLLITESIHTQIQHHHYKVYNSDSAATNQHINHHRLTAIGELFLS